MRHQGVAFALIVCERYAYGFFFFVVLGHIVLQGFAVPADGEVSVQERGFHRLCEESVLCVGPAVTNSKGKCAR